MGTAPREVESCWYPWPRMVGRKRLRWGGLNHPKPRCHRFVVEGLRARARVATSAGGARMCSARVSACLHPEMSLGGRSSHVPAGPTVSPSPHKMMGIHATDTRFVGCATLVCPTGRLDHPGAHADGGFLIPAAPCSGAPDHLACWARGIAGGGDHLAAQGARRMNPWPELFPADGDIEIMEVKPG